MSDRLTSDIAVLVRLPQDLREALHERARREDRTVASLIRQAAWYYLDQHVDQP